MKLHNEFTVASPLERTWATLLDIPLVGSCLPGATIEPSNGDGLYRGRMRLKLGPMTVAYQGFARLVEIDEDAHRTVMDVQGREAKGQGTAAATIVNSLEPTADGGTRVAVDTELQVTGRQAQFGRGIMQDVAGGMLGQFAQRLERLIARTAVDDGSPARADQSAGPGAAQTTGSDPAEGPDALDLGGVVGRALAGRTAVVGAVGMLALVVVLLAALRPRRRQLSLRLDLPL